ncbi:MAG TPA: hypothetical protein VHB02_06455 [Acidimicrobiales bacterium]|nr:hypothetical protein [Acidimicrobiales bacterium]
MALGATLPDLAHMAGLRYEKALLPPAALAGVGHHGRSDASFHANGRFLAGSKRLRRAAEDAGVPAGASRAIGHVGWELLFDGVLLGQSDVAAHFVDAVDQAGSVAGAFAPDDRASWWALAAGLRDDRWWLRYEDPEFVARRLHRLLWSKPRLRLSAADLPAVTEVLSAGRPAVQLDAEPVVDAVVSSLSGPSRADR